jgi:hypothetical protein
MRDVTDAPSIVPEQVGDSALSAAVAIIQRLADAKREGDRDALADAADLFHRVPGLRGLVHSAAVGISQSEVQGARSSDRKRKYEKRNVARARAYQKRRLDPMYAEYSDSDLKAMCGQRLVRDPTIADKDLRILERSQAIKAIDAGLELVATGRFALSSR